MGDDLDLGDLECEYEFMLTAKTTDRIKLGGGQFGTVYLGKSKGTEVAIKVLKPQNRAGDAREFQRKKNEFFREVKIMSSPAMKHPNIVQLLGASASTEWAMITELCAKGSLDRVLFDKDKYPKLDVNLKMQMAIDICSGMAWMSGQNIKILHRDLKSPNILIDENWRCKIGDFGLSLLESRGIIVTGRKGIVGSALYQAPEALMERENDITEKTDVWAFGLIFWEIITRQKVFDDFDQKGDLDYFIQKVVGEGVVPPLFTAERTGELEPIDPILVTILTACWAHKADNRPTFETMLKKSLNGIENPLCLQVARTKINLPASVCKDAYPFWTSSFDHEIVVDFKRFFTAISQYLKIEDRPVYANGCMKLLPSVATDKTITIGDFSKFVKWFGPIQGGTHCFAKMVTLLKQNYFYGQIDQNGAEACLKNYRDEGEIEGNGAGIYLVRLNTGVQVPVEDAPFTISHILPNGLVKHTRVYRLKDEHGVSIGYYCMLEKDSEKISSKGLLELLINKLVTMRILSTKCVGSPFIPNDEKIVTINY